MADDPAVMTGTWAMTSHGNESVTLLDGISNVAAGKVTYSEGSWVFQDKEMEETVKYGLYKFFMQGFKAPAVHTVPQSRLIAEAVAAARASDVVVACVGESQNMNGEGASRTDISIPDAQMELLKALKATGKPVVMVLVTGRPLTLEWENEEMDAILNVWSPGSEGGNAVADVLFGDYNPSGKLPLTFYRGDADVPDFNDYDMTDRTYRYFKGKPLFEVGHGLSYSKF
jgi:beta-glucosidase